MATSNIVALQAATLVVVSGPFSVQEAAIVVVHGLLRQSACFLFLFLKVLLVSTTAACLVGQQLQLQVNKKL